MKALITGGTGFVGSHLARQLIDAGHTIRILHRTSSKLDALAGLDYESAIGDVTDADALRAACGGCDWVFHVAAVADYWRADTTWMFEVNVEGTRKVLTAAQASGVKRVVFTSSAAAVGIRDDGQPADETVEFNLPPERFPYGYSKYLAEGVSREFFERGLDVVTVNPVVIMGPGDMNLISGTFILQIHRLQWTIPVTSGGVAVIDVRDVARLHIAAAEKGRAGERYILSTANYSNREWFGMIAEMMDVGKPFLPMPNFALPVIAGGIDVLRRLGLSTPIDANQARLGGRNVFFDARKADAELGKPLIDMDNSLRDTYAWYVENGYIKDGFVSGTLGRIGKLLRR